MFEKIWIFPFVHICIWTFMDSYSILEKIEKIVQFPPKTAKIGSRMQVEKCLSLSLFGYRTLGCVIQKRILTHCVIIFISVRIFIRMSTPGKSQKIDDFMNSPSILGFVTYGGITKTLRLPAMVASAEATTTSTIWDCVIGCSRLPFIGFIDFTMWAQRDLEKKIYDVFRRMTVVCQWGVAQFSKML